MSPTVNINNSAYAYLLERTRPFENGNVNRVASQLILRDRAIRRGDPATLERRVIATIQEATRASFHDELKRRIQTLELSEQDRGRIMEVINEIAGFS